MVAAISSGRAKRRNGTFAVAAVLMAGRPLASGALAGRAIAEGLNYERMTMSLSNRARRMMVFRKAFNTLDNVDIDRLVGTITLPGIKQVIYNTNLNIVGMLCPLLEKRFKRCPSLQSPSTRK